MKLPADLGPISIPGKGRFIPAGRIRTHGVRYAVSARVERTGVRLLTARFLVGFNVGGKPHWTEDDLIRFFVEIREKQERSAGASFISQRGIWHPLRGRREPDEQGAQILVINEDRLTERAFTDETATLGEELTRRMDQDAVYLDIQKAGRVIKAFTLTQE